jgi:hypothetical protein
MAYFSTVATGLPLDRRQQVRNRRRWLSHAIVSLRPTRLLLDERLTAAD